jgi:hypothetical protein
MLASILARACLPSSEEAQVLMYTVLYRIFDSIYFDVAQKPSLLKQKTGVVQLSSTRRHGLLLSCVYGTCLSRLLHREGGIYFVFMFTRINSIRQVI